MTHFLFLEKAAQRRERERAPRAPAREPAPAARRRQGAADRGLASDYLYLVLPTAAGFRVLRAAMVDVTEVTAEAAAEGAPGGIVEHIASIVSTGAAHPARARGVTAGSWAGGRRESFGEVEIDVAARVVLRGGEPVNLAPMELDLLLALIRRRGAAASRRDLLREVWGTSRDVSARTVDTHIANLRRKVERSPAVPRHILTVKKVGYRLQR